MSLTPRVRLPRHRVARHREVASIAPGTSQCSPLDLLEYGKVDTIRG